MLHTHISFFCHLRYIIAVESISQYNTSLCHTHTHTLKARAHMRIHARARITNTIYQCNILAILESFRIRENVGKSVDAQTFLTHLLGRLVTPSGANVKGFQGMEG
jgi:hypothetical protein